ncbi:THUMP-like domain-containing protein [Kocuria atrinae]|uniref:THUMP-like domain-containing protein n=1 Tax=Kocuria atrinae TaxID=592377 RepID=UPI0002F9196F|nr:methyltransferase [Kocuria atrinae]
MNSPADAEMHALAQLLTPQGLHLVDSIGAYDPERSLKLSESLRAEGYSPELVSAALTQAKLRTQAKAKFGEFAQHMVFTRNGLEQATRWSVAALHARRFAQADLTHVADLGCGIGADSLALAALERTVTAVEKDELTAAVATVNLTGWPNANVVCGDVETLDSSDLENGAPDGVWLDPARRVTGSGRTQRVFDPEAFSPPLSFVTGLADQGLAVGAKLGPGIPHDQVPGNAEAQWVSDHGDVVEVVLWFNAVRRPNVARAALVLDSRADGSATAAELTSESWESPAPEGDLLGEVAEYLYEPDGAVIRAGLVTDLAQQLNAHLIHPTIAYLSGDELHESPLATAYRVREVLPHNVKTLKKWVRDHNVGTLNIKKRGTDVTPEQLRKQLAPRGSEKAMLVMTRLQEHGKERRVALVVEPVH